MKCIRTRHFGPSNVKGSRIIADVHDGTRSQRVIVDYDYAHSIDINHSLAAMALLAKMGWSGELVTGWHNDSAYHVFKSID